MIVVASDNPDTVEEISVLLKQKGDLFTIAADETLALAAIRADRASLLIVDTGSQAFNGIAFCHEVRGETEFSNLPVLCLIDPIDLRALLSVLDSTADGFLSRPFDLGSLSAAIGDLQDRQASGPAGGAVRTQFRISHEGRDYTITADRRQLLEYLLAAFETAVRIRRHQDQIQEECRAEIRNVSERLGTLTSERDATVNNLHGELEERSRTISRLNAAIVAKEQAEDLLKTQKENVAQELKDLGAELEKTQKSDEEKGETIVKLTSDLAAAAEEKSRACNEHATEVDGLNSRLHAQATELETAASAISGLRSETRDLEGIVAAQKDDLSEKSGKIQSLEKELDEAREALGESQRECRDLKESVGQAREALDESQRECRDLKESVGQAREALDESQRECNQLKESLESARTAAEAKEREVRSALDNLNAGLRSLEEALEQNLRNLERELAARRELEVQVESVTKERDALARRVDGVLNELARAKGDHTAVRESLVSMQTEYDAAAAERERLEEVLESTYRELARINEENAALRSDLDNSRNGDGENETAALKQQCDRLASDLSAMQAAVAGEQEKRSRAESDYKKLQESCENSRSFLDSAVRDIGVLNAALAEERDKRRAAEELHDAAKRSSAEKDREIAGLREELDAVQSAARKNGPIIVGPQDTGIPPLATQGGVPLHSGDRHVDPVSSVPDPEDESCTTGNDPVEETAGAADRDPGDGTVQPASPPVQMTLPTSAPAVPLPGPETPSAPHPAPEPVPELPDEPGTASGSGADTPAPAGGEEQYSARAPVQGSYGNLAISRDRWLDITKWAHHTTAVTEEQRKDLVANLMRLSKLVQKGRHLTNRQEQEIRVLMARVQSLGYRFV